MEIRVHLQITGRVQGVGYRNWASQKAQALGLKGWVRNCPNGSVEAEAQGLEHSILEFVQACHQGPLRAQVREVKKNTLPVQGECVNFEIRF